MPTRRFGCAENPGVESHAKRHFTQVSSINIPDILALLPATDFGREHHPPHVVAKCIPPDTLCAAIEFPLAAQRRPVVGAWVERGWIRESTPSWNGHPDRIDASPVPLVVAASAGGGVTHP